MTHPSESEPEFDPALVAATRFTLTPMGRRGYQPDEVHAFVSRVAAELARRDAREESLRAEADKFRDALRDWQSRQSLRHNTTADTPPGADAVQLLSRAQQQAEGFVAQAQDYSRQLIGEAREQAKQVLDQARRQAEEQAGLAEADHRDQAGALQAAHAQEQARRLTRVRSFLDTVTAAEDQLREAREKLASEVDDLAARD